MQYEIGRIIGILSNQIKRYIDRISSDHGLTGMQGRVLHFILVKSKSGEVFQKDIEEEFNLRRSTATGILQLMEKNGIIRRESVSYDARLKNLIPTDKSKKLQGQVDDDIRDLETKLRENIDSEDLKVFYKVIIQMSKNLNS